MEVGFGEVFGIGLQIMQERRAEALLEGRKVLQ